MTTDKSQFFVDGISIKLSICLRKHCLSSSCGCAQCLLRKKDVISIFGSSSKPCSSAANVFPGNLLAKVTVLFLSLAGIAFLLAHYCQLHAKIMQSVKIEKSAKQGFVAYVISMPEFSSNTKSKTIGHCCVF